MGLGSKVASVFGYSWDIYREIIPLHEKQFRGWISPLEISFFKGKRFLDAGCGIGRNSLWPLNAGAASAVAFDFDTRTVAIAKENLKKFPHCQVDFQSIYELPFRNEFDVAFCIGVVHHLEHPKAAVKKLAESLKTGGTLILWVYAREGNERYLTWFDPMRKFLTSRIHPFLTLLIAKFFTALLKIYLFFPHKDPYMHLLKERSFRHMEALVFDQMIPTIAHYWTKSEVEDLVAGLPVEISSMVHTNETSWTLVAKKS